MQECRKCRRTLLLLAKLHDIVNTAFLNKLWARPAGAAGPGPGRGGSSGPGGPLGVKLSPFQSYY